jgi:predicted TIM-barrel fold metal-dependent hydrolase
MAGSLREELGIGHPIVDMDGHVVELVAATLPYLRDALGADLFQRYVEREQAVVYAGRSPGPLAERMRTRVPQRGWWTQHTTHTFERALPMFPQLYYERMDTLGIDYAVLYPTNALTICAVDDPDLRRGVCRGYNDYFASVYGPYADRLTASGIVPMHDPAEAIAELEHCKDVGIKVVGMPEGVLRPIEQVLDRPLRWMYPGQRAWFDVFGLDSIHDYDPVWRRASELGLAVSFHGGLSPRPGVCTSVSNFSYNHVGMFMQSMYPLCKALFMGGVATRFPDMRFAFLECGVSWAVPLLADMTEHWEKRRPSEMSDFDPANLDLDELVALAERYGGGLVRSGETDLRDALLAVGIFSEPPDERDDWAQLGAPTRGALAERFATSFYFGCEADDRTVGLASARRNGLGVDLNATLGSDIGHWDVAHAERVIPEAFELVEHGVLTEAEFRSFTFDNAVSYLRSATPAFFAGTIIEPHISAATDSKVPA